MTDFHSGEVYRREFAGFVNYAFVVGRDGENAKVLILPHGDDMVLEPDNLAQGTLWRPEDSTDWYVERVAPGGTVLVWAGFVPDFECALALAIEEGNLARAEGGYVRVAPAKDATPAQLEALGAASALGEEDMLGFDAAAAILTAAAQV